MATTLQERQRKFLEKQEKLGRKKRSYFVRDDQDEKIKMVVKDQAYVLDLKSQENTEKILSVFKNINPKELIYCIVMIYFPELEEDLVFSLKEIREFKSRLNGIRDDNVTDVTQKIKNIEPEIKPIQEKIQSIIEQKDLTLNISSEEDEEMWKVRCEILRDYVDDYMKNNPSPDKKMRPPGRKKLAEILEKSGELNPKTGKPFDEKTVVLKFRAYYPDYYREE